MAITGGQAIIDTLRAAGVTTVFGIPGVHNLSMYDALYRSPDIDHIVCRHEQGAGFAADGYARVSGKTGVFITTTGPGATNAFTALGEAWTDNSPVLHLASQLDRNLIDRNRGVVHELVDQHGTFRQITRLAESVRTIHQVSPMVARALAATQTMRPRPAYLDFPVDMLNEAADIDIQISNQPQPVEAKPSDVERAAEMLARAERPVIVAGSGVHRSSASAELLELAGALNAPVFETANGRGAIPSSHRLAIGGWWHGSDGLHAALADADATLVAGSRLGQTDTSGWKAPLKNLIHVDADGDWINLNYPAEIGLIGHERTVIGQLLEHLEGASTAAGPAWAERVANTRRAVEESMRAEHPREMGVLDAITSAGGPDAIFTNDSLIQYWTSRQLPVERPRSYLYPAVYGTLGSALPFAIGAAIAAPERPVISISGDGAFMFTCQELATAVQYGVNITCVICNDHGYGAMRRHQRNRYGDYTYATDLATPDFAAMAESFGARGVKLESTRELEGALRESINAAGPTVIDMTLELDVPWM
ncbi:thiamine pyrophosphate-binding protein [soil metagenome]